MQVTTDYRQDNAHWWVLRVLPEGGVTLSRTTWHGDVKTGTMVVSFAASHVAAAYKALSATGSKVNDVQNAFFGPGSGVQWFNLEDPHGNQVVLAATQSTPYAAR